VFSACGLPQAENLSRRLLKQSITAPKGLLKISHHRAHREHRENHHAFGKPKTPSLEIYFQDLRFNLYLL